MQLFQLVGAKQTRVDAKFHMHNLFLTDIADEQIHIMKPGTSSLTDTQIHNQGNGTQSSVQGNTNKLRVSKKSAHCTKQGDAVMPKQQKNVFAGIISTNISHRWPVELQHERLLSIIMKSVSEKT